MISKIKNKLHEATEYSKLISALYSYAHDIKVRSRMHLDDVTFAKRFYRSRTGRNLNLEEPKTFDEKQWWMKIHYRHPLMTICADKYRVREYVHECGLENILNKLYGVYETVDEIDYDKLPNEFILKTNHGCGGNFICTDQQQFPKNKTAEILNKKLNENYYYQSREWPYKNIKPCIIAEKLLKNDNGEPLVDYRFLCFHGKCKCIFIDIDTCAEDGRHKLNAKRNVYDGNMNLLNVKVSRENFDPLLITKPADFEEMRTYAEKLSEPFPFCRVDFYYINNKIYFGEMTFYHAGSSSIITPTEFENKLGEWIKLPEDEYVVYF